MRRLGTLVTLGLLVASLSGFAACAEKAVERPPTRTVAPTGVAAVKPSGTQPAAQPSPTAPARNPDPAAGQQLFTAKGCAGCHSTKDVKIAGPGLGGIKDRAGTRVAGLSAKAYLEQSIRNPNAFVVEGFSPNVMPMTFGDLSAVEMQDLIAYLETL